jgi:ABC-type multidrug transport system fused ATPase/permease subunit
MSLIQKIRKSKYHLLFSVLPIVFLAGVLKFVSHLLGWEVIPKELTTFFPSILTGIIFILGFLLAGVVTDYKESERIPNDIAASLYAILQEAEFILHVQGCASASGMMTRLKLFVPTLKTDFFLKQNDQMEKLLDALSGDVILLGKEGATVNYLFRMKNEITNLKKIINRISVIKHTDFIPSVFVCIQAITITFLSVYCLLAVDPWWGGLILVCIFTFVIFAILFLIKDMEDPFEYDGSGYSKSDEISLAVLDNFQKELEEKLSWYEK